MRRDTNPDVKQVELSLRNISQRKVIKKIKGGDTTFEKSNPWKSVWSEPLQNQKKRKAVTKLVYLLSRGVFAFRIVVTGDSGTLAKS